MMNSNLELNYFILSPNILSGKEVLHIVKVAYHSGKQVVLNTIPHTNIRRKLLRYVSIAIFNERQMSELTGVEIHNLSNAKTAALKLYGRGAEIIVVKMSRGEMLVFSDEVFSLVNSLEEVSNIIADEKKLVELIETLQ